MVVPSIVSYSSTGPRDAKFQLLACAAIDKRPHQLYHALPATHAIMRPMIRLKVSNSLALPIFPLINRVQRNASPSFSPYHARRSRFPGRRPAVAE